ncbi:MAG: hypothetical protein IJE88_03700 [Akkermansia sp.]|nr:hypothetical protein [Akkermansia sp.]
MTAAAPLLAFALVAAILFGFIYLGFFIAGRTQCTKQEILRCSAALTGTGLIFSLLSSILHVLLPIWDTRVLIHIAFIILHYQFGRRMLKLSWKRAVLAVCITIGLFLVLFFALISMLYAGRYGG